MPNLSRQVFWTVCERRWLKQSESAIRACEQFEFRSSDHLRGPETPCPGIPSCMLLNTWILKRIISASSFCPLATIFRSIRPAHWSLLSFVPFVSRAYRAILLRESNFSNSSVITVLRYGHLIIFFSVGVLAYSFESFAQANQSVKNR